MKDVRNAGVGYIPEDRHEQGLVLDMTIWENVVLGRHDDAEFSNRIGVLFIKKVKDLARQAGEAVRRPNAGASTWP